MESLNDKRQYLLQEKQKMSDAMKIFTVFLDIENRDNFISHGVAPSVYMQQMLLTTEERTASLIKQERRNSLVTGHAGVCFSASPNIVIFQQFSPGYTYSVTLSVTNITSCSQNLKMICTKNPWFKLECKDAICKTKLAPGMSIVYDVKFFPEERRDYKYQADFAMGAEIFSVPILAIGPRPMLDFPDSVEVPQTAVKILSMKQVLVRNVGDVPGVFSLSTIRPFTVFPQKGILAEGETMQVTVNFLSEKKGCFKENLTITYETGEIISLKLFGVAEHCVIKLERESIRMEETYLGLTRSKTFAIHNKSDYVTKFRWVLYENRKRDQLEMEMYKTSFEMMKNIEVTRSVDVEHYNICDPLLHELACQRVYTDELSCLTEQTFPFHHPNYRLTPLEGEIWPHSKAEVILIFEPDKVGLINGSAYLEVTGCEERIPLNLQGMCVGPMIRLNITCADLGCIFLCSNHNCEVICGNKGDIPGTLVYNPRTADFGGGIGVNPVQVKLEPGTYKSFNLCFSSNRTGIFTERVDFIVKESLEVISLFIKGSVICPTLHFDKQNLDFGVTPLGFSTKHDVCLHNSSLIPVTFCAAVLQDGTQQALTHEDFSRCVIKPSLVDDPKEFAVVPSEGVVAPHSFQRIKISYTPNVVKSSQTVLRVDMWDSDSEPVTLPIRFSSKVASLVVRPSEIFIRFCFVNFPYMRFLTVENKSDVEGYFYLPPQSVTMNSTVMYSLSSHQGYLKPNESKSISLKIITTALGRQKVQLSLLAFGDKSFAPCCSLICNGQGPNVTVQPTQFNWGEVPLLEKVKSTITLTNDSPIPAQFLVGLHNVRLSPWTVSQVTGILEPNKSLALELAIYLRDAGNYSDKVDIEIMNSRVITCPLSAIGIGTSINFIPKMMPEFDMGLLFRDQDISIPITMVNKGTRHHRLTWTTMADNQVLQTNGANERQEDKFTIDPCVTDLSPGAASVVHCKIRWGVNESLTEQWYLYGQIKGQGKRQVLGTSRFRATFINPNILFSQRKLTFRYDPGANETKTHLIDTLFVTNKSRLDLRARVNIEPPFEIIVQNANDGFKKITTIFLQDDVTICICIRFNTKAIDLSNLYSKTFQRNLTFDYETHCAKDEIECVAEVNFPNISFSPMEPLILSCEVGSTAQKSLTLVNTGRLPVHYSFEWLVLNAVKIPPTACDMPRLQARDSSIIHKDEEEKEETQGGDGEGDEKEEEEEPITIEYLFGQGITDIASTIELDRFALSAPATSCGDLFSTDTLLPTASGQPWSPPRRLSTLMATNNEGTNNFSNLVEVTARDIRDFIFPMIERYFLEDTEISVLKLSQTYPTCEPQHSGEFITEVLDVVPREGIVLPYSSQHVCFELDCSEPIEIDAKIACLVKSGPTETIIVQAFVDMIRYSIDKKYIDFHWQPFGESCRTTLTIINRGVVEFTFETYVIPVEMRDRMRHTEHTVGLPHLRVEPKSGVVNPMSKMSLDVIYYVGIPGPIHEQFDLEIAHHSPIPIHIEGYGSLPQVHLTVSRSETLKHLPMKICYQAIGTLTDQLLAEVRKLAINNESIIPTVDKDAPGYLSIPKCDEERFTANGWEVISRGEVLPTVMDIEMAVERLLTIEHMHENLYIIPAKHSSTMRMTHISSLFVPEYIIDMGYVVVERVAYYSTMLINYGPIPVDVHVARVRSKRSPLKKSGIVVKFHNRKALPVGESTSLNITFHPTRSVYTEKRTDIGQTIYLEVTHGAMIPISVRAVATYPVITAHTAHLSFGDVAVGNCMLMPVLLRNDGWVPCEWQATIRCEDSRQSKQEIGPFFLHCNADAYPPGYENVINIHFKPKEAKYSTGQLRIKIAESIFPVLVSMSGTGIEAELHVSEDTLTFEAALPYVQPGKKTFSVKNTGSYPVEVFWRNFDTNFMEEERMIRILTHYYGVDEILFPPRHPGDKLSPRVYQFCQTLSDELAELLAVRKSGSERTDSRMSIELRGSRGDIDENHDEEIGTIRNEGSTFIPHQPPERTEMSFSEQSNGSISQRVGHNSICGDKMIKELVESNVRDSQQTEALLHAYIDELHRREDFLETMKDPMKGVFEDAEIKLPFINRSQPLSRPCIIFHGAPFTAYQQAACQVGNMIGVSILNIDKAITEIIALGKSDCSNRLREIIDKNYDELLSSSQTYRQKLSPNGFESNFGDVHPAINSSQMVDGSDASSRRTPGTVRKDYVTNVTNSESPAKCYEQVADNSDNNVEFLPKLPAEPDVLEEFNKIPSPDEIKSMDPLDEYEYKIQSVVLLQKIISSAKVEQENIPSKQQVRDGGINDDKATGRSDSTGTKKLNTVGTFLGISSDLIYEALKQRLAMEDFQIGFTVQTMNNIFVKNERDTLVMLLSMAGNFGCQLLFVTYHNTLKMYLAQNEKLVAAKEMKATEELENKVATIEQMTRAEYDHISEDDRTLYASNTLAVKKADSQRRDLMYNKRLAEAMLNKKIRPSKKRMSIAAQIYDSKTTKSKTTRSETVKSVAASSSESPPTKAKQPTPTNSKGIGNGYAIEKKYQSPKQLEEISKLMDTYRKSFDTLQPVLANWDARNSTYYETTVKMKTSRSARGSDVAQQTDESKGIDVWHVAPVDPWNSELYEKVASYLSVIQDNNKTVLPLNVQSKISMDSKLYSVIGQKTANPRSPPPQSGVYTLTSLLTIELPAVAGFDCPMDPSRTLHPVGEVFRNSTGLQDESTSVAVGPQFHPVTVVEETLEPRWVIQPNELRKFQVHFTPKSVGIYKDEYNLDVVGSNITRRISINGSVDIPRLSMAPEIVFNQVKESKSDDLNKPAYFLDTKTYDFGSIPLMKIEGKMLNQTRETKFVFLNISAVSVTVFFSRMDNSDIYGISSDLLNIAPGQSEILNVSAGVSKTGPNLERLLLCIRNNPRVEIIQLRSYGSQLEVELEGKFVAFDKILLWRKAKRTIIVKNKSSVPLHWRLDFYENSTDSQVMLHPDKGRLEPLATSDIECTYSAKVVGIVERRIIAFHAYLGEYDTDPMITDFITITGETYDVKVDLSNVSPIDFKSVRVGTLATETFTIKNRGPCDVEFMVQPETQQSLEKRKLKFPPTLTEDFKLVPASGSLSPEKPTVITVNFLPRGELTIFEAPLFKCLFFDTHKTPTAVAECPLLVSVSVHHAKVKVEPSLGLHFGPMAIFDTRTMYLEIENVGHFSFEYKITGPAITALPPDATSILDNKTDKKYRSEKTDKTERLTSRMGNVAQSKKDNKTPRTARSTKSGKDQKISTLKVGPFVLSRDEGEIEAGKAATIAVQCCLDSVGVFKEDLQVFVPNTGENRKNREPIRLSVTGCIPTIDLHDFDAIFRGNLIVNSVNDFRCPRELGPHSIYGRQEKCLYFRRVVLSSVHTAQFRLYNPGFVSVNVNVKFESEMNETVHDERRADVFTVEPQEVRIPPMSTGIFTVSFSPKLLGSYLAAINIVPQLPPPLKSLSVSIKVCGEGAVPEVALLEPTAPHTNDLILMNFGRYLVDEVGYRLISFKNVGLVRARVIAEISGDVSRLFTFEMSCQDIEGSHATWQRNCVKDKRRIVRYLMPEEIYCVNVKFAPNEVGKYEGRLDVFTVDNPYQTIAVAILGESYVEDVILEGLGLTENIYPTSLAGKKSSRSRKSSRDSHRRSSFLMSAESITPITTYKLDYGSCPLNELKRICFRITNKSKDHLFRFEWVSHPNVVFSPSVGHLNAHGSKDIIATFSALVPIVHTETQLECTINEITQLPGETSEIYWDDRQINVRWDEGGSSHSLERNEGIDSKAKIFTKVAGTTPEAVESRVIEGSTKTVRVMLCAVAAYSRYDCPIREINFKDLLMFQSCKYTFVLSNAGIVDMTYKWNLSMDAQYPERLSNSALRDVLRSLENPPGHDNCKSSMIISSKADNHNKAEVQRRIVENACDPLTSTAVVISDRTSADSWAKGDHIPFEIIPEIGVISPGKSVECTLLFSPLDVFDYQAYLTCRIENLDPELPPLSIIVTAKSLLPYCHFDVPDSDYLSGGRRNIAALGPLENVIDGLTVGDVRVVEIQALGVGLTNIKKFVMINPTPEDYHFSWHDCKIRNVEETSYLSCSPMEGVAEHGKQTEFIFTFAAMEVGVFESMWIFSIEKYKLETRFLFVTTVMEPSVYLIPGHLKIKSVVMGATARDSITIFNNESIDLSFRIMPKSLYSDDRLQRLDVKPMSGTVQPKSQTHLRIKFQTSSPGESEFFVHCRVDKLKAPLVAVVSTTAYIVEPRVVCKKDDEEVQQSQRDKNNTVLDCEIDGSFIKSFEPK